MQKDVKKLIDEGRFEITMGGWSATDESTTNYEDIIANFMKGHTWLKDEFGVTPTVGWNIDSFGHTQANAALFHDLGFEALFFARLGLDDVRQRYDPENHSSHFLWRPMSKHFGAQKEILGGLFGEGATYLFPKNFNIDERTNDDTPIQPDATLTNYNVKEKASQLINIAQKLANG